MQNLNPFQRWQLKFHVSRTFHFSRENESTSAEKRKRKSEPAGLHRLVSRLHLRTRSHSREVPRSTRALPEKEERRERPSKRLPVGHGTALLCIKGGVFFPVEQQTPSSYSNLAICIQVLSKAPHTMNKVNVGLWLCFHT